MTKNKIKTVRVQKIREECKDIKSFRFNVMDLFKNYEAPLPGQFIMVWVPGVDEIPMSLSSADSEGNWMISVKKVGECTKALHNLSEGDYIGIRGPLGNAFKIPKNKSKNIFLIGGGIGTAPLGFLAQELHKKGHEFTFIEGVKQRSELFLNKNLEDQCGENSNLIFCTDDGSYGVKGFASTIFRNMIQKLTERENLRTVAYTCGPEIMMYETFKICEEFNIPLQASLERIMRCGCGLCGLCALEPLGLLVCKDGPVFPSKILRQIDDFAKYKMDFSGKKISLS
ncbi:MAG: dihydroorotate dehydrogenase electron transfer subunit [Promethearchaeota archaeon]|nr:MAG: dihydroorotate dehydrogenase electron transfer subunit [Candidatus Lokiarchaeota archaeon]